MVDVWNEQFLLVTKLTVPQSYARPLVSRSYLYTRLECGISCPLILISAPAGFGKTTLLSSWLQAYAHRVAWVSLDSNDNALARFWEYCLTAIVRVVDGLDELLAAYKHSMTSMQQVEYLLTLLINALTARQQELLLVLDDYQAITSPSVQRTLDFFITHLPSHVHVVISSRVDPVLPLARWRVEGRLFELRGEDLRFSLDETIQLLHDGMRLPLTLEDIAALKQHTEGWIAGLQLAALSLQEQSDKGGIARCITSFAGTQRPVLHYLTEEVLERLPERVQQFLLMTSILERMNASLCDAVTEQGDGDYMLAWLDQQNLFLSIADEQGTWYRYHHLFMDLLRYRLMQQQPAMVPVLHSRASLWYERQGMLIEAIEHALLAADQERAAALIEQSAWTFWQQGYAALIDNWLLRLQEQSYEQSASGFKPLALEHYPVVAYFSALHAVQTGDEERYQVALQAMYCAYEGAPDVPTWCELQSLAAYKAIFQGDSERALMYTQRFIALTPHDMRGQGMIHLYRGVAFLLCGDTHQAFQELLLGHDLGLHDQQIPALLTSALYLGDLSYLQGRLSEACNCYQECSNEVGERMLWSQIQARFRLGSIYLEWNDLERAEELLCSARKLIPERPHTYIIPDGDILAAQLAWLYGKHDQAHLLLDNAESEVLRQGEHPLNIARIALLRVRYWLAEGSVEMAARWSERMYPLHSLLVLREGDSERSEEQSLARELWLLIHAKIALSQRRPAEAVRYVQPLLIKVRAQERRGGELRILIVLAQAYHALNDPRRSKQALEALLTIAQRGNYRRTLLDEGQSLISLIAELYRRQQKHYTGDVQPHTLEYMHGLLQSSGYNAIPRDWGTWQKRGQRTGIVANRLSERELEVLKLIAEGHSNQQIAQALVVAESTIKTHLNNIYGKLNVNSRLQALTRAHATGILEL